MTPLTIELPENEYKRLQQTARHSGKSIKSLIEEWILQLPNETESTEVSNDPLFQIEGFDSEAPRDYSSKIDSYLFFS